MDDVFRCILTRNNLVKIIAHTLKESFAIWGHWILEMCDKKPSASSCAGNIADLLHMIIWSAKR